MGQFSRAVISGTLAALTATANVPPSAIAPVPMLAATALYMGGTGHPLSIPEDTPAYIAEYISWAYNDFVGPSALCTGGDAGCAQIAVRTPAAFWPVTGLKAQRFDPSVAAGVTNLDNCLRGVACTVTDPPYVSTVSRMLTDTSYTVFGYSQSATVASIQKSNLIAHPPTGRVSFVLEANPNRPNGGVLERFVGVYIPLLRVTFNGATVTNSPQPTPLTTVDVVHQYDPIGDFPLNPLNLLADLNSLMGFAYEHPEEGAGTPVLQGQYQDSTYYLIPTQTLPLLRPLTIVPFVGPLIATVLDPPLRVLVEAGYNRTINPGAPTPAQYLYFPNPITTTVNFLAAIPNGLDNGIAYLTGDPANRPFHTTPQGPYGVGGPPVNAGSVDPYSPPTPYTPVASVRASSVAATGVATHPRAAATHAVESSVRRSAARSATRTRATVSPAGAAGSRSSRSARSA